MKILSKFGQEDHEHEGRRVRLGAPKLSQDSKIKLMDMVNLAKTDYRDLIVSAE